MPNEIEKIFTTPSGGKYSRKVKVRKKAARNGNQIHHKAYSYTNKAGKTIHVAAHTEHARGTGKKVRATATKTSGGVVSHRAYSYTNKAGKTVHVAAHTEKARSK